MVQPTYAHCTYIKSIFCCCRIRYRVIMQWNSQCVKSSTVFFPLFFCFFVFIVKLTTNDNNTTNGDRKQKYFFSVILLFIIIFFFLPTTIVFMHWIFNVAQGQSNICVWCVCFMCGTYKICDQSMREAQATKHKLWSFCKIINTTTKSRSRWSLTAGFLSFLLFWLLFWQIW